ncbi:zinc finger and BTB domain-containing protein 11-like [Gossypium australe]|uniref:Zinc finger and BTB domain-containing protein 11-like n=1 Tax=Gossypium australe TaxID=47621 RepID=A0A5B6WSI2_9ROSI|nr:zinc finger and BTB domain-containing protein 11-like [Gossypium australe]
MKKLIVNEELRQAIIWEAHASLYAIHPRGTKMYQDVKELYWWPDLKRDITDFVAKCFTC